MAPHDSAALYDHDIEVIDEGIDCSDVHPLVQIKSTLPPNRADAEAAVKTLISYTGENADRPGVLETPKRVVKAFDEWFGGYKIDADGLLSKTFDEVEGYQDMVLLRDIPFHSHCEHHMAPIIGKAHVAYMPKGRVVGISKLARVVDAFARRFQIQERMTEQAKADMADFPALARQTREAFVKTLKLKLPKTKEAA